MKFMIVLVVGKAGSLARKIGIASIYLATAFGGVAGGYSVDDKLSIPAKDYSSRSDVVVNDEGLEDRVNPIKISKVMHRGKVLHYSGVAPKDNYTTSSSGGIKKDNIGSITITPIYSFLELIDRPAGTLGEFIEMVRGPPLDNYDNLMRRNENGEDFMVDKNLTNVYHIGFIDFDGEWSIYGGYANNDNGSSSSYPNSIGGWCSGSIYDSVFPSHSSIEGIDVIHDPDGGQFSVISNDVKDINWLVYDANVEVWYEEDIEFNGIQGGVSELPDIEYGNGTLILPHMSITPYYTRFTTNDTSISDTSIAWLREYGYTNNMNVAVTNNPDGDLHLNWQEYRADTNPLDSNSVFSVSYSGEDINFYSSPNCSYNIYSSEDLESWTNIVSNVAGTGGEISTNVFDNSSNKYFKVGVERVNR